MKALFSALIILVATSTFAIEGLERLKLIDCELRTESGIVEENYPINKAFYAQSEDQAAALFLSSLWFNALSKEVSVTSVQTGKRVTGIVSSVKCKTIK